MFLERDKEAPYVDGRQVSHADVGDVVMPSGHGDDAAPDEKEEDLIEHWPF